MKTLIAGIIGAAVAAVAWIGIEQAAAREIAWLACGVGLITGLAVRAAAEHSGESIGRGALAAILALAACFGSFQMKVAYLKNKNKDAAEPQVAQAVEKSDKADAADGEEAENPEAEVNDQPVERRDTSPMANVQTPAGLKAPQDTLSDWSMVWLSLSAVLAYVVGKGSSAVAPATEEGAAPEDAGAADAGSEDAEENDS